LTAVTIFSSVGAFLYLFVSCGGGSRIACGNFFGSICKFHSHFIN